MPVNGVTTIHQVRTGPGSEPANNDLSEKLNDWLAKAGPSELFRTCGSCRQMQRNVPAHCDRFGTAPPVDIILAGCDFHEDEAIAPF